MEGERCWNKWKWWGKKDRNWNGFKEFLDFRLNEGGWKYRNLDG